MRFAPALSIALITSPYWVIEKLPPGVWPSVRSSSATMTISPETGRSPTRLVTIAINRSGSSPMPDTPTAM
ncbi:MAG: hypothetical protein ACT6Q3_17365, partial [Sphingopyxis sp.]